MCGNFPNIKVTEGNAFSLVLPLKKRTYESCKPIDEDIDIMSLEDVVFKFGGVEYAATKEEAGVRVVLPATLARGVYDIVLTAMYQGSEIRAAYESAVSIVAWNSQSDAQQFIPGSPIVCDAAYVIGGTLTDAELEALKEEFREKNSQLAQAIADAEAAKREWEEKAADLDGVAKEQTLTQGVQDIRDDISHIDIDTSTLAKETSVKDGNDTAISVSKEIRSEVGTGSDTAAETGTLFAIVKWLKDKVKSISNYIGTPASGQPSTLFAAIAAGGGGGDAQESTSQAILAALNEIERAHIIQSVSIDGYNFIEGTQVTAPGSIAFQATSIISVYDEDVTEVYAYPMTSCKKIELPNLVQWRAGNSFRNNNSIVEILLPKLETTTGDENFALNAQNLERLIVPRLNRTNLGLNSPQAKLIDLSFGAYAASNINISGWSPSIALDSSTSSLVKDGEPFANNLEKLLYNIREHIAAILRTDVGNRTITFSAAVKAAILADQPTADAFTNKNWTIA